MKRFLSLILVFALVLACTPTIPFQANAAVVASGTCGTNVTWKLETPGVLTISGTGKMTSSPWYDYSSVIKSVIIESGVTSIGDRAFLNCSSLTSVVIGDSVTSIGNNAFYGCRSLTTVKFNAINCTTAGSYSYPAFGGCTSLTTVIIGDNVRKIPDYAFSSCNSLESVYITDLAAWCKISFANYSANPLYYAGKLYLNGELLTNLVIPDSVTSIGSYAFEYCSSLESVVIPDSVTSIGSYAFEYCSSLESVVIPDSVESIGERAFKNCSSLTSIEIPDSVTSIGFYAFEYCSSLTSVVIGDSVTSIGAYAFSSCDSLTSVVVGDSVTSIGSSAFSDCSSLTSVVIPDSVTSIGAGAFSRSSLTSVAIPDSVTSIGSGAFSGCSSLTSVVIGDSVESIGDDAFYDCSSLKSVVIPDSVTSILSYAFQYCRSLESVTIPESVVMIGSDAFQYCSKLTDVYYGGNLAQWNEIMIASGNDVLTNATIHTTESEPVLVGISVAQKPNKTEYVLGEELDTTGLVLTEHYSNSSTAEITDGFAVSGFDSATTGTKTITVTYEGYTTTFTVTVDLPKVCQNLETGEKFTNLEEAFAVVTDGTIQLLMDATADALILNPGVELDLNGYTLTAKYMIVANGATILDSGVLKIAKDNLIFAQNNGQNIIPVWNGVDGYVFTKVTFQQLTRTAGEGAAQYIFLPRFSNPEAAALMADGGTDNGVKIKVCLTWNNGQSQQFYTYSDDLVAQVFASGGKLVFSLNVTGIANITDMVANAVVVTDSGAQASNATINMVAG